MALTISELPDPALSLFVLPEIPLVAAGDDLSALIIAAVERAGIVPRAGDVFAVAQKIVSKAEGRVVQLNDVTISNEAQELAERTDKDARVVQLILDESTRIVRERRGVIITQHRLGLVLANAGIDRSNVAGDEDTVLLLPQDPDGSAASLRAELENAFGVTLGIMITDSFGRPWRLGTTGVAIGCAGVRVVDDQRGRPDMFGRTMQVAEVAVADSMAAAAGLLMGEGDEGNPVILMRFARDRSQLEERQTAADVIRCADEDLFK